MKRNGRKILAWAQRQNKNSKLTIDALTKKKKRE
jgi:hypothetical protein